MQFLHSGYESSKVYTINAKPNTINELMSHIPDQQQSIYFTVK